MMRLIIAPTNPNIVTMSFLIMLILSSHDYHHYHTRRSTMAEFLYGLLLVAFIITCLIGTVMVIMHEKSTRDD